MKNSFSEAMKSSMVAFVLICLLLSNGANAWWNLTEEEDAELDRRLRVINKPAIKTIENEDGDIIDCVAFEKQPSFDHLSSKNQNEDGDIIDCVAFEKQPSFDHLSSKNQNEDGDIIDCVAFEKQPSFDHLSSKNQIMGGTREKNRKEERELCLSEEDDGWNISHLNASNEAHVPSLTISKVPLKSAWCPQGSVPIRRTTKEDLVRSKLSSKFGLAYFPVAHPQDDPSAPVVHWAVLVSDKGSYKGASAFLEVHGLSGVEMNQYSGTIITIFSGMHGPPDKFNAIFVGWVVHPSLYGDSHPRLTVFWTTDGYRSINCFNFHCPGFIQRGTNYFPGMSLKSGDILPLGIQKHEPTGDWCISTLNGKAEDIIGCLSGSIFTSLQGNAEYIEWGGTVMYPAGRLGPPMGNGHWPRDYGARVSRILAIDEQHKLADPTGRLVADKPRCYNAAEFQYTGGDRWSFDFGGPGRCLG